MAETQKDSEVVVRYADGRGQLVVDGVDIAGVVVRLDISCQDRRATLGVTVDVFGTRLDFHLEAVELIATVPMSSTARRALAGLAYEASPPVEPPD
jgi:hypothetical protein